MKAVVFLGPTLSADAARALLPGCEVRPPAVCGDVLRALNAGARQIGIVDGCFDHVLAVWHKEILFAMERGAFVYGSASMGALRGAELHTLGMIGVGRIFEWYRDGVLEDDDEVALVHGPSEVGYLAMSEAMVDIRDRIDAAVEARLLPIEVARHLTDAAKSLSFRARSFAAVAAGAEAFGMEPRALQAFRAFVLAPHRKLKARDAMEMLRRMATGDEGPRRSPVRVERTVFLERLRLIVDQEAARVTAQPQAPASPQSQEHALGLEERTLLGLLAEKQVEALGIPPSGEELEIASEAFRTARNLLTTPLLQTWLEENRVSLGRFEEALNESAAIRKLLDLYGPEVLNRLNQRIPP